MNFTAEKYSLGESNENVTSYGSHGNYIVGEKEDKGVTKKGLR